MVREREQFQKNEAYIYSLLGTFVSVLNAGHRVDSMSNLNFMSILECMSPVAMANFPSETFP